MSDDAIRLVQAAGLPDERKAVLLVMAALANDDGIVVVPTEISPALVAAIADQTHVRVNMVAAVLMALQEE